MTTISTRETDYAEASCVFPQSSQANAAIVLQISPQYFPSLPFQIRKSLLWSHSTPYSEISTVQLNKLYKNKNVKLIFLKKLPILQQDIKCTRKCNTGARSSNHCWLKISKYYIGLFWASVCRLSYLAYNAHAPCHLCPVGLYNIFQHYLMNGTIFEKKKKLMDIKCVFTFPLHLLSERGFILKNLARFNKKCILVFMQITC